MARDDRVEPPPGPDERASSDPTDSVVRSTRRAPPGRRPATGRPRARRRDRRRKGAPLPGRSFESTESSDDGSSAAARVWVPTRPGEQAPPQDIDQRGGTVLMLLADAQSRRLSQREAESGAHFARGVLYA